MKKIVLIPDSFKGTMSSAQICSIMAEQIRKHEPAAEIIEIPVADGGEGSVAAFIAAIGGEMITCPVSGPFGDTVDGFYGWFANETAVIEMAAAAGMPLAADRLNPAEATTFGVGQLIQAALEKGAKKIIIGVGGSATNDGGAGAAAALGVKFLDQQGHCFIPVGGTLHLIDTVDMSGLDPRVPLTEFITMCDVDNPFNGPQGAAYIFAMQKGADAAMVHRLDQGLEHLAALLARDLAIKVNDIPGAGAAGGMGGGTVAFFGSKLEMGIETVLNMVNFDQIISGSDLVISGEGKLDKQSLRGKVIMGIANRTKKQNIPLIAVVGDIGDDISRVYERGVSAVFSINRVAVPFAQAKLRAQSDLALTIDNLFYFMKILKG